MTENSNNSRRKYWFESNPLKDPNASYEEVDVEKEAEKKVWQGERDDTFASYDNIIKVKDFLDEQFPNCGEETNLLLGCEHFHPKEKVCQKYHAHLSHCISESYCPKEAKQFFKCVMGIDDVYPNSYAYPPKCQKYWNLLDKCMISHTVKE